MEDKFVTLSTYNTPNEAYMLIGRLESEGIDCYIEDDNLISVNPLLSNAIGGVKLNVSEKHLERALLILKEIDFEFNKSIKNEPEDEGWEELREDSRKQVKSNQRLIWGCVLLFILFWLGLFLFYF